MVKNKKALILLLVFLAFFNRPAYSKDKRIKYLPSSQDIETVSANYPNPEYYPGGLIKSELPCSSCDNDFYKYIECIDCVDLKGQCPDCCLTATSPKAIKCSLDDKSANYNCTAAPFEVNSCAQTECGAGTTGTGGSRGSDDTTDCYTLVCSGDKVSSGSPYGLQRRGCPDADSDELKPNCPDCSVTGTDSDGYRIWSCPAATCGLSLLSPSFQTCSATSGTTTRADSTSCSPYYDVGYIWAYTTTCETTQSCNNQCNPTCTPVTPSCSSSSSSCASTTCTQPQNCPIPCTPPCWDQLVCPPPPPCPKGPCPPPPPCFPVRVCGTCTDTPCTATANCTTTPYIQSYTYSLSSTFKNCIGSCANYADDYEKCRDGVDCCEQAVCLAEGKTGGYSKNCTDASCAERLAVSPACYNSTAGQCNGFIQAAEECLEGATGSCFKEIDSNSDARYDFVARTGEAYNVIWQINTTPDDAAKSSKAKFYTMVKVVDPNTNLVVYSSMLHQKGLNAAFSIYGTTLIPKDTPMILSGKHYQIQLHYFMYDYPATDYKVEIKHMSLIVTRVRE